MRLIFRIETKYGIHDADTYKQMRERSKDSDHIQLIAPDGLTIISRVTRRGATRAWALRWAEKTGYPVFFY